MEFWTSVKVIVRRWYVVLPCLVLTVVVGVYLVHQAKPVYKASGSVLLSTSGRASRPETTSTLAAVNPYANMDQSQLAFLVSQTADSSSFQEQMTAAGANGTFSVTAIPGEPAMTVSMMAATPDGAMSSYRKLVGLLNSEIDRKQLAVGAPASALVGVQDWTTPSSALPQNAAKVKALIVVVVVGLLLTLALTFLVDALLTNGAPWSRSDEEDELLTGPVAVPVPLDAEARDEDEHDDELKPAIPDRPPVRSASRFEFVLPLPGDRGPESESTERATERARRGSLPPWSPPEERTRAAGS